MLRSHARFYPSGSAPRRSPSWSLFAICGGRITPSCQNSVCCSTPFPRRLPDKTKQSKAKEYQKNKKIEERARDLISNGGRSLWAGNEIPARTGCGRVGRLIIVSTRTLGRARKWMPRCTRCVVRPEAILRKRKYRNAHFAPNFRHHPGIGGHRTPCYVPTPVSTPPGALRDARPRGHFFAIFGGRITPSCQNSVCCSTPFPRRLPDNTKQSKGVQK